MSAMHKNTTNILSESKNEERTMQNHILERCVLKDHNYFNANLLRKHQEFAEANTTKCEFCFVTFDKTVDLQMHIERNHLDIKPEMYHCNNNNCPLVFNNEHDLVKHIDEAHDESQRPKKKLKKKGNYYRKCFVPGCASTSTKFPNKIFLCVPTVLEKRRNWFRAVNREYINTYTPSKFFCCEDHFDLQNDTKNWLKYKIMGPRPLLIKDGVLPRISVNKPAEGNTDYEQATMQQSLLKSITNKEIDIEFIDLYQSSSNSVLSVSDLLTMSDDKLKFHIKNKGKDKSDDTDWCINDEQKQALQDIDYLKESRALDVENEHSLKNEYIINTEDVFKEDSNLDKEIYTENKEILIKCDNNRSKDIKEKNDLPQADENNLLEPIKEMLYCNDCPSSFPNEEDMLQHIRVWHGTTNRRMPLPTRTNDSLKDLQNLVKVRTKDVNLMMDSDVFERFENFQRGNVIQSSIVDLDKQNPGSDKLLTISKQRHVCTICNRDYAYNHFKSHMKEVHSEIQYICEICGAHFKCERYLKRHTMYRHTNKVKPQQMNNECKCPECPKTFKNSDCLSHHVRNCHGNKVECELCHSKLKSISYLKSHMRRVHYDDGKKHKCRVCCKEFKSPRQVKIHMINLHPETLYPCPHCIRLFCSAFQLKIHLKKKCQTSEDVSVDAEDRETGEEDAEKPKTCDDDDVLIID